MKNSTTAVILVALGLALPATTFGQNTDPAPRAPKRPVQRKMAAAEPVRPSPAAQPAPLATDATAPVRPRQRSAPAPIAAIDVNHDGVLEAAEIAKASETLRQMDKDADGILTAAELRRPRASRVRTTPSVGEGQTAEPAQSPAPRSRLGALDANKDGVMDANE